MLVHQRVNHLASSAALHHISSNHITLFRRVFSEAYLDDVTWGYENHPLFREKPGVQWLLALRIGINYQAQMIFPWQKLKISASFVACGW
jgi:hypothetical protein